MTREPDDATRALPALAHVLDTAGELALCLDHPIRPQVVALAEGRGLGWEVDLELAVLDEKLAAQADENSTAEMRRLIGEMLTAGAWRQPLAFVQVLLALETYDIIDTTAREGA